MATALVAGVALAFTALAIPALAAPAPAPAPAPAGDSPASVNGFRSVGYVMADTPVTRDYQVADLLTTGATNSLTHLNYAFGNVTTDLVCDITNVPGEGDAFNDFQRLVSAADSVDGVADVEGQTLAGNFNQLLKFKEKSPNTKVMISLGGWTWSDNFSEAASTTEGRTALIESCVDLYIRGNVPVVDGMGGEGTAAGIFDGIDVDWEWPVNGGETSNARPEDKENFLLLMEEFRAALDAEGEADGTYYELSAFAPAGGWNANAGGWTDPRFFDAVDFLNVQGYDFTGGWAPNEAGHQGNLWGGQSANGGLGLDSVMAMYVNAGADLAKLNVGLAAYGAGWSGVTDGTKAWQPASGAIGTNYYAKLRNVGTGYFDEAAGASWRWDAATGAWWSLDDPKSINAKSEWIAASGFGGAMWWDMSGDFENELVGTMGSTLRAGAPGPLADDSCAMPWYNSGVYTKGDVVSFGGSEFKAKWWTRNQAPSASSSGSWTNIGDCGTAPAVELQPAAEKWVSSKAYPSGAVVNRGGVNFTAQWWTKGERPGTNPNGAWRPTGLSS